MKSRRVAAVYLANFSRAQQLADELMAKDIDAQVVRTSESLYQLLNYQPVDIVIIENKLLGFLSGFEILERLYNDLLKPATILLENSTPENQERAKQIGGTVLVPPNAGSDEILATVERLLARSRIPQTLICPEARKVVSESGDIPAMPQLLVKLTSYLHDDNLSIEGLANDISVDSRITADLLKVGNSSAMGVSRRFTKVFDVVNYLGASRTVSLIISNSVVNAQSRIAGNISPAERLWYNRRSILVSSATAAFAKTFEGISPDTAQVAGLLQEIGILVLLNGMGQRYQHILKRVREVGHLRLEVLERERLNMTHADVSAALLQKWDFPNSLVSLIQMHHSPDSFESLSNTEQRFLHCMRVGEALANLTDGHANHRFPALAQLLSSYMTEDSERCTACLADAVANAAAASKLLSIPVPKDEELVDFLREVTADHILQAANTPSEEVDSDAASTTVIENVAPVTDTGSPIKRIAVLEDDFRIIEVVEHHLGSVGIEVIGCSCFAELVDILPRIDGIIIDIHLGGNEDGREIIEMLRKNACTHPIIVLSGDRSRNAVGGCILAGANDFISKPFAVNTLIEKVQKHLG